MNAPSTNPASFAELLQRAVTEPGTISAAYSAFHGYSIGNQLLALVQCTERGIPPGPIATFMGWKEKGRYVKKGEKAITLCMPVTIKKTKEDDDEQADCFTRFIFKPKWFVLAQTDGQAMAETPMREWDRSRAVAALTISEE